MDLFFLLLNILTISSAVSTAKRFCQIPAPAVENGYVENGHIRTAVGRTLVVRCNSSEYYIKGFRLVFCLHNGWSTPGRCIARTPRSATRQRCAYPPYVPNANVGGGSNSVGSIRIFWCNLGFELTGVPTVVCGYDQYWQIQGTCAEKQEKEGKPTLFPLYQQFTSTSATFKTKTKSQQTTTISTNTSNVVPIRLSLGSASTSNPIATTKTQQTIYFSTNSSQTRSTTAFSRVITSMGSVEIMRTTMKLTSPKKHSITRKPTTIITMNTVASSGINAEFLPKCCLARIDSELPNRSTWLFSAINNSNLELIDALLQYGNVDVNARDTDGRTPLLLAASLGNFEMVMTLLGCCADIEARSTSGFTALLHAADTNSSSSVDLLLRMSANVNAQDNESNTALMIASRKGYSIIVKLLLRSGADKFLKNSNGDTAESLAIMNKRSDILLILSTDGRF